MVIDSAGINIMNIIWDYAFGGVNFSIPGNGGPECIKYLSFWQKIMETVLLVPLSIYGIIVSSKNLELPSFVHQSRRSNQHSSMTGFVSSTMFTHCEPISSKVTMARSEDAIIRSRNKNVTRYSIIAFYSLIFGMELVYKVMSKTCIFLLNPCHVASLLQIILLTMRIDKRNSCLLFRFHMYLLPGALIALVFPVLNTFLLPGEVFVYFVQHLLILTVPLFMLYLKDAFLPESLHNVAWPTLSFSIIILYHYTILQMIGLLTQVNVSCILCPAVSDPIRGRFYRLATVIHQGVLIPLITKFYNSCARHVIEAIQWYCCMERSNECSSYVKKTY